MATPISDDQSRRQVVEPARQFVTAGALRVASGTYLLQSCSAEERPPYRGQAYLTFEVPTVAKTRGMFAHLAEAMTAMRLAGRHHARPPSRRLDAGQGTV